jgi:hypothetical protein
MSTGRHAGDTARRHQPRTRQQPREVHTRHCARSKRSDAAQHLPDAAICGGQPVDPGRQAWGWRASRRYRPTGQGRDEIRAHDTVRAALRASPLTPVTTRMPSSRAYAPYPVPHAGRRPPGPGCPAGTVRSGHDERPRALVMEGSPGNGELLPAADLAAGHISDGHAISPTPARVNFTIGGNRHAHLHPTRPLTPDAASGRHN